MTLWVSRLLRWLSAEPERDAVMIGELALELALVEIGNGEEGGNNQGADVFRYRGGHRGSGAWCAWFVAYCFKMACFANQVRMPFAVTGGAKRLYKRVGAAGRFADEPRPGDVACWDRGVRGSWQGHVGIVSRVADDGVTFWAVEGNRGRYPSLVDEFKHCVGEGRLIGFARV